MAATSLTARRILATLATIALVGCSAPARSPALTQQPTATPASASAVPSVAPTVLPTDAPSPTSHPNDGVSDPDGRIAFGRIVGSDPFYGSLVAIWAIDPDGSDLVQLTTGSSGFPAWAPDGSRLAFTQRQPDGTFQIVSTKPDGTDLKVLTHGPGADNASWFPDGSLVVFQQQSGPPSDADFHTTIWWMNADGSNPQQVGHPDAFDVEPKVSPNGSEILFARLTFPNGSQRQQLVIRSIATSDERVLAAGMSVEHPAWSPDGRWIVYDISPALGGAPPNDQVMRIRADGTGQPEVLFQGTADQGGFKPVYSPDGSRILFGCFLQAGATDAACLMDADGSNVEVLIDAPSVHENHFHWGPPTAP